MKEIVSKIRIFLAKKKRNFLSFFSFKVMRSRLNNKYFTLISNNCMAGVLYHQLGLSFMSPTINLIIPIDDYFAFINNIDKYLNASLKEIKTNDPYPVGEIQLKDNKSIRLLFVHYDSFFEAKRCWERRKERIIKTKTYFIIDLSYTSITEHIIRYIKSMSTNMKKIIIFNEENKIDNIDDSTILHLNLHKKNPMDVDYWYHYWKKGLRMFNQFDWVSWLNNMENRDI